MSVKEVLYKLSRGENSFECNINGQERTCEILKIDLRGLNEDCGRALVKFTEPIKSMTTRRVENLFSLDEGAYSLEDVEEEVYEIWLNIGY